MDPLNSLTNTTPLTADQQAALKKLHAAATQLEGVFVGMLFKEMHKTVDKDTIFGKDTNADDTWQDMLDEKQADAIAPSLPAAVTGPVVPTAAQTRAFEDER